MLPKEKIPPEKKKCISVFFRGFVAIVLDEGPRSGDNAMLWSIYLGTSELFIYKCLTSRRRLASLFLRLSRLLSVSLFLLSSNLRATWVYRCRYSKRKRGWVRRGRAIGRKCKGRKPRGRTFALPVQRAVAVAT